MGSRGWLWSLQWGVAMNLHGNEYFLIAGFRPSRQDSAAGAVSGQPGRAERRKRQPVPESSKG